MYYGLIKKSHFEDMVIAVCDVLGHGKNKAAFNLIMETSYAETNMGTTPDTSVSNGHGITQIDEIGYRDVIARTRKEDKEKIYLAFGIDLGLVRFNDLRYNPLLSAIITRLKYKFIPEQIPADKKGRAKYWKKYYNTVAGKGTTKHYLEANALFKGGLWNSQKKS